MDGMPPPCLRVKTVNIADIVLCISIFQAAARKLAYINIITIVSITQLTPACIDRPNTAWCSVLEHLDSARGRLAISPPLNSSSKMRYHCFGDIIYTNKSVVFSAGATLDLICQFRRYIFRAGDK